MTYSLLGPLVVKSCDRIVDVRGGTGHRLLGALLLHANSWVHESRLVELTWNDANVTRNALHCAVARIRRIFREHRGGDDPLERSAAGYRMIVSPDELDSLQFLSLVEQSRSITDASTRFDTLLRALALWRGEILADTSDALRTNSTVLSLERSRIDCTDELADLAMTIGRDADALPFLERLALATPYDEPLQARLISVMGNVGRRAEGLRVYERVRARLAEELGVDPSGVLRKAHLRLLTSSATETPIAPPACRRLPTSRVIVPAQLPPAIIDFVSREAELQRIADLLSVHAAHHTVPLIALCGRPGVGKYALAVNAAHQAKAAFPDGQVYVELAASTRHSRPVADVLAQVLRALGILDADIPNGLAERGALYRSCFAGRRILVVLDDVPDDAAMRHLVPGSPGCAVLVTSTSRLLAVRGVSRIELDVLDRASGLRLLAHVIGPGRVERDPAAAASIVEECGRLPLAILAAAAQLTDYPHRGLRWLADLLSDEQIRLTELSRLPDFDVRGSLEHAHACLAAEERRLFGYLGSLPSPTFDTRSVMSGMGCAQARAERLIGGLLRVHLARPCRRPAPPQSVGGCQPEHGDTFAGSYELDPLARGFASEQRQMGALIAS